MDSRWVRRLSTAEGVTRRLICFPHAGGSASFFVPFAKALGSDTEVLAVQYPGRQDRRGERCAESIPELADSIVDALAGGTDLPCAFFGHSMGSLVAFEVARRLGPEHRAALTGLFVSGRRAPARHRPSEIYTLGDEQLVTEVAALGGTDHRVLQDPELREMVLPAIRADYRAVENYRYEPGEILSCPVSVLVGQSDPHTADDDASEWGRYTDGAMTVHVFPGGHFFLVDQVPRIAALLDEHLCANVTNPCSPPRGAESR